MSDESQTAENEASPAPAEETEALRAELAEMRDRMLRALADAENTRRRAEREKQDASQYAIARFARDMLQIADNFARAMAACPPEQREAADPQVKAVLDGVEATERQLLQALQQHGVKQIDTADGKFDPNLHQAIAEVPGNGKPGGSIVDVVQPGYTIGERLLRPAMVTVARRETGSAQGNGVDTKA
ncbi:MAG: nucleotide exchange factor GrpE [Alphaproteobacteria bacterium]|nr:nucleotide exchange factor GrpE [Alphaproteobacteria bacterium]MBV9694117.1 nucleotide exchange factor GrpE [Alphaproteobacteria bacterium]